MTRGAQSEDEGPEAEGPEGEGPPEDAAARRGLEAQHSAFGGAFSSALAPGRVPARAPQRVGGAREDGVHSGGSAGDDSRSSRSEWTTRAAPRGRRSMAPGLERSAPAAPPGSPRGGAATTTTAPREESTTRKLRNANGQSSPRPRPPRDTLGGDVSALTRAPSSRRWRPPHAETSRLADLRTAVRFHRPAGAGKRAAAASAASATGASFARWSCHELVATSGGPRAAAVRRGARSRPRRERRRRCSRYRRFGARARRRRAATAGVRGGARGEDPRGGRRRRTWNGRVEPREATRAETEAMLSARGTFLCRRSVGGSGGSTRCGAWGLRRRAEGAARGPRRRRVRRRFRRFRRSRRFRVRFSRRRVRRRGGSRGGGAGSRGGATGGARGEGGEAGRRRKAAEEGGGSPADPPVVVLVAAAEDLAAVPDAVRRVFTHEIKIAPPLEAERLATLERALGAGVAKRAFKSVSLKRAAEGAAERAEDDAATIGRRRRRRAKVPTTTTLFATTTTTKLRVPHPAGSPLQDLAAAAAATGARPRATRGRSRTARRRARTRAARRPRHRRRRRGLDAGGRFPPRLVFGCGRLVF